MEPTNEELLRDIRAYEATVFNLEQKIAVLAAEGEAARNAVQTFCDVVGSNTDAICEELGADGVRVILAAMSATGNIPATVAAITDLRAQGAYFVANRMLADWDAGFIDDSAKNAADIARMILTSTEFMADAPAGDFDRSFADGVLTEMALQLRAEASK